MRRFCTVLAVILTMAMPAFAGKKIAGTATLRDSQPVGTPGKGHKHQAYDLSFDAQGNRYMCRTDADKSMNATDFVVGGVVSYEIDGQKAKIRTAQNKKVECRIVRVEAATALMPPTQQ